MNFNLLNDDLLIEILLHLTNKTKFHYDKCINHKNFQCTVCEILKPIYNFKKICSKTNQLINYDILKSILSTNNYNNLIYCQTIHKNFYIPIHFLKKLNISSPSIKKYIKKNVNAYNIEDIIGNNMMTSLIFVKKFQTRTDMFDSYIIKNIDYSFILMKLINKGANTNIFNENFFKKYGRHINENFIKYYINKHQKQYFGERYMCKNFFKRYEHLKIRITDFINEFKFIIDHDFGKHAKFCSIISDNIINMIKNDNHSYARSNENIFDMKFDKDLLDKLMRLGYDNVILILQSIMTNKYSLLVKHLLDKSIDYYTKKNYYVQNQLNEVSENYRSRYISDTINKTINLLYPHDCYILFLLENVDKYVNNTTYYDILNQIIKFNETIIYTINYYSIDQQKIICLPKITLADKLIKEILIS